MGLVFGNTSSSSVRSMKDVASFSQSTSNLSLRQLPINALIVQVRIITLAFAINGYCEEPFRFRDLRGLSQPAKQMQQLCPAASIQGIILVVLRACHGDRDVQTFLRKLVHPYVVVH
jgi:hypothetical protein